jgi:hypothetical protein
MSHLDLIRILGDIILHEAHEFSQLTRARLRYLQRHYKFPKELRDELIGLGIDLSEESNPSGVGLASGPSPRKPVSQ